MLGGPRVSKTLAAPVDCLKMNSLATCGPQLSSAWVESKSLLDKDKTINRRISVEELCGIYDLPIAIRPKFKDRNELPFLNDLPLKLLMQVGIVVTKKLMVCHNKS